MKNKEERVREFLECLGNGKSIDQCESENNMIDETMEAEEKRQKN